MFIEFADFPTGNWNHGSMGALSSAPILKLKEIQGGHTGIEMKMKRCLASSLAVGEARELFGIPEEKFNLKTGFVERINFQSGKVSIGRK